MARSLGFGDPGPVCLVSCLLCLWTSAGPGHAQSCSTNNGRVQQDGNSTPVSQPAGPQANPGPFPSFPSNLMKADPALQASALRLSMIWSSPVRGRPLLDPRLVPPTLSHSPPCPQETRKLRLGEREDRSLLPGLRPGASLLGVPLSTPAQASAEVCSVPHTHTLSSRPKYIPTSETFPAPHSFPPFCPSMVPRTEIQRGGEVGGHTGRGKGGGREPV